MGVALGIAKAVKDLIELYVDGRVSLIQDAKAGDQGLLVQYGTEYRGSELIVLRNNNKAEMHTIQCTDIIDDKHVLILCEDVTAEFSCEESWVQKTYNKQVIEEIVIGNPDHLDNYPAVTIEVSDMQREPITLESVTDQYTVEIGVWMDATTYNDAYETVLNITDKVEHAIFKDLYPLVEPYFSTILTEDVLPTDNTIRVENDQGLVTNSWVWLTNKQQLKKHNKIKSVLEPNVVELAFAAGATFYAGDYIVRPLVNLYDPRIESISYDDAQDQDHLLKSSTITYSIKLHRQRPKFSII